MLFRSCVVVVLASVVYFELDSEVERIGELAGSVKEVELRTCAGMVGENHSIAFSGAAFTNFVVKIITPHSVLSADDVAALRALHEVFFVAGGAVGASAVCFHLTGAEVFAALVTALIVRIETAFADVVSVVISVCIVNVGSSR